MRNTKAQPWNEAQEQFVKLNYSSMSRKEILEEINKLGEPHTENSLKHFLSKNKILSGRTGRFYKGQPSYMTGRKVTKKQYEAMAPNMFKKGNSPWTYCAVGTERTVTFKNGAKYLKIKIADPNVWEFKHRLVWQKEHGELQPGERILFLDGNPLNCEIENLRKITTAELGVINTMFSQASCLEAKEIIIDYAKIYIRLKKIGGQKNGD